MNRCVLAGSMVLLITSGAAGQITNDSSVKIPKHYFNTVIVGDFYRKPEVRLDTTSETGRKLATFGAGQAFISFYTPIYTRTHIGRDSTIGNNHLLLTGNFYTLRVFMDGLRHPHRLTKNSIGIRYIYNTGKKGVLFIDVSPFVTRDWTHRGRGYARLSGTFIYSHNQTAWFNWRLGITKSFVWGNRYYLPFLGLRVGRLDKVNISIQLPRSIQFTVPAGDKFVFSLYSRAQGGMFYFSNYDTIYFRTEEKGFHFTRYEIASGLRIDFRTEEVFSCYLSAGLSTRNQLAFYGDPVNRGRSGSYYRYFYRDNLQPTSFVNFGLIFRFGETRSYFNDRNIYDAIDLNNTLNRNGDGQIPLKPRKLRSDYNLETIEDLIEYTEI